MCYLQVILRGMDEGQLNGYLGLDHFGPRWAERLHSRSELERLLAGVLALFPEEPEQDEDADRSPGSHLRFLGGLATSFMRYVAPSEAPELVIDVALRVRAAHRHRTPDEESQSLIEGLTRTRAT